MTITPQESRAARALLGWNQTDLAKASNVGIATVKRFETGVVDNPIPVVMDSYIAAFTKAGIIFETGKFIGVKIKR
jgi:predicted transcriptional regulator